MAENNSYSPNLYLKYDKKRMCEPKDVIIKLYYVISEPYYFLFEHDTIDDPSLYLGFDKEEICKQVNIISIPFSCEYVYLN